MKVIAHKPDVYEVENFLSTDEVSSLIAYFESDKDSWQQTCFYNARVMDPIAPWQAGKSLSIDEDYMKNLRFKLQSLAEELFSKELKNLSLSAHKWLEGAFADYHSDNTELDGTPNAWRENKLVTIIYLNDDYSGGDLIFRDHPIKISPKAGTVVVFDVGIENVHGVTEVTAGSRWTMLASFDYADSTYPEDYWEQKRLELEETAKIHQQQRQEWETEGMPEERVLRSE
jgi:predicted 2-oxoglutarate/Fe(II)-dependent dioxygenase YbiX